MLNKYFKTQYLHIPKLAIYLSKVLLLSQGSIHFITSQQKHPQSVTGTKGFAHCTTEGIVHR